jgi:hypothetical protein
MMNELPLFFELFTWCGELNQGGSMKRLQVTDVLNSKGNPREFFVSMYLEDLEDFHRQKRSLLEQVGENRVLKEWVEDQMSDFLEAKDYLSIEAPVALFFSKELCGFLPLPLHTASFTIVADSFHVKPVLKWLQRDRPFALLLMKKESAYLFYGSMTELKLQERFSYRQLVGFDGIFNSLDRAVYELLQKDKLPLVLAGPAHFVEPFLEVCQYTKTIQDVITEEEEWMSRDRLLESANLVMEPFKDQYEDQLIKKYWTAKTAHRTSSHLSEIVVYALDGAVKHLFINESLNIWGKIDHKTGLFDYKASKVDLKDDDLLDDLAQIVLRQQGLVTTLPSDKMPEGHSAVAILRGDYFRNFKKLELENMEEHLSA